jgi:hypothetical protein
MGDVYGLVTRVRFPISMKRAVMLSIALTALVGAGACDNTSSTGVPAAVGEAASTQTTTLSCPPDGLISATNLPPDLFPGPCDTNPDDWPAQTSSDIGPDGVSAMQNMITGCNAYCGQSTSACIDDDTQDDLTATLFCYNQEYGHRWLATCQCTASASVTTSTGSSQLSCPPDGLISATNLPPDSSRGPATPILTIGPRRRAPISGRTACPRCRT